MPASIQKKLYFLALSKKINMLEESDFLGNLYPNFFYRRSKKETTGMFKLNLENS